MLVPCPSSQTLKREGLPAYTTSMGWIGFSNEKIQVLCRKAKGEGFTRFKVKVGQEVEDDVRRWVSKLSPCTCTCTCISLEFIIAQIATLRYICSFVPRLSPSKAAVIMVCTMLFVSAFTCCCNCDMQICPWAYRNKFKGGMSRLTHALRVRILTLNLPVDSEYVVA